MLSSTLMSSVSRIRVYVLVLQATCTIGFRDQLIRVVWNAESKAPTRKSGTLANATEDQLRHVDSRSIFRENYTPNPSPANNDS